MASSTVYKRKNSRMLWCSYYDANGKRRQTATPYVEGEEDKAQRFVDELERQAKRGVDAETGAFTVRLYAAQWIKGRRDRGVESVDLDEARLKKHALPVIGSLAMSDVRPRHLRELVHALKAKVGPDKDDLAPRTVRHIFGSLHTMFADAVVDELISVNPCVLKRDDLPKKIDKDPMWRAGAIFTRDEVETLISSPKVPDDRRVLYTLMFLTGARFGEIAALRWSSYDKARTPLAHLLIAKSFSTRKHAEKSTKTQVTRDVPVHPTLARVLAEWKLKGWPAMMGRQPKADDLIIPSRIGKHRSVWTSLQSFKLDLTALGLRHRRQHDARRTFITLARRDGARADILESVTHGARGDIVSMYSSLPFELLCEEVAKLKIELREGKVIELPMAVNAGPLPPVTEILLQRRYSEAKPLILKGKSGDPYGIRNCDRDVHRAEASGDSLTISQPASSPSGSEDHRAVTDCNSVTAEPIAALLADMQRSWSAQHDKDKLFNFALTLMAELQKRKP